MEITPTLNFSGQCRQAMEAYAKAFGGSISCMITCGEANDPAYLPLLHGEQLDYIYHGELMLGNQRIIMSDHVDIELGTCYANFLTVMFDTKEEVGRAYRVLEAGSTTIYPMEERLPGGIH